MSYGAIYCIMVRVGGQVLYWRGGDRVTNDRTKARQWKTLAGAERGQAKCPFVGTFISEV